MEESSEHEQSEACFVNVECQLRPERAGCGLRVAMAMSCSMTPVFAESSIQRRFACTSVHVSGFSAESQRVHLGSLLQCPWQAEAMANLILDVSEDLKLSGSS